MDTSDRRVPLSITVREDLAAFALRCAESREIGSMDRFFDTALEALQMHMDALLEYIDAQKAKGLTDDDIARRGTWTISYRAQDH